MWPDIGGGLIRRDRQQLKLRLVTSFGWWLGVSHLDEFSPDPPDARETST
jgi:hypothetical protein